MVAAGSGSRLGASVPKALVELGGVPLVRRSVDALAAAGVSEIVVTIPAGMQHEFAAAMKGALPRPLLVEGGMTRQDSVRLGLAAITAGDDAVALVHDAARALVPPSVIRAVAAAILSGAQAAIPVVPVVDSIRRVTAEGSAVVDRTPLRAVQTPQGARLRDLRAAHEHIATDGLDVTDDASACEHIGLGVTLVPGHRDALKITEPGDLLLADAVLGARADDRGGTS